MNKGWSHIIQFVCIMTVLTAIVVQGFTSIVKMRPLSPYIDKLEVVKQDLTFEHYSDGSYQMYLAKNAWKKAGFREFFSRCYNQVAFTFFGKTANPNVKKGSHNELYLTGNLDDITGKLFGDNVFDAVQGFSETRAPKPDPAGLYELMDQFGATKEQTVYVGDGMNDIMTAHNAGIPIIAVVWDRGGRQTSWIPAWNTSRPPAAH